MSDGWELAVGDPSSSSGSGDFSGDGAEWWSGLGQEEFELPTRETSRDALIILLDFSSSMTIKQGDSSHLSVCLSLLSDFIKRRVISDPEDLLGLVLFGTNSQENQTETSNGIHQVLTLSEPDAKSIRQVNELLNSSFDRSIGHGADESVDLYNALWYCLSLFHKLQSQQQNNQNLLINKRIIILTCHDKPYLDENSRRLAIQKSRDLRDYQVEIQLIPLNPVGKSSFDARPFYCEILSIPEDEPVERLDQRFKDSLEEIRTKLNKKQFKKRALGTIEMEIGGKVNDLTSENAAGEVESMKFAVKIYVLFKEQKKESAVNLDKRNNERVESITRFVNTRTVNLVNKYEYKKFYSYGGEKVVFSEEEIKSIKELGQTGLKLIGFKPVQAIKPEWNVKNPYFIYPDESSIIGSTTVFHALLKAMEELQQVAICRLIYRRGSPPRFVALFPQLEKLDHVGNQLQPPGFHLVFLPYSDDIRKIPTYPTAIAEETLQRKARKIVEALHLPGKFNSALIPNPSLQKHYQVIQALALEESAPQEVEDLLKPDVEGMQKFRPFFESFEEEVSLGLEPVNRVVQEDEEDEDKKKRKIKQSGEAVKRAKVEVSDSEFQQFDWPKLVANGELKRLKIDQLKIFLRHKKLPLSGTKSDLLQRIMDNSILP
jgi:ATP-dependent DNA helicase 2 subunit 1